MSVKLIQILNYECEALPLELPVTVLKNNPPPPKKTNKKKKKTDGSGLGFRFRVRGRVRGRVRAK